MHARIPGLTCAILAATIATASAAPLTPADIQATFFNGQPFTAATTSGVKFKMIFTADGKMTREPAAKTGARGEGTWKLDKTGFCTTWKGQQPNCYSLVAAGANKWSVMKKSTPLATWSK